MERGELGQLTGPGKQRGWHTGTLPRRRGWQTACQLKELPAVAASGVAGFAHQMRGIDANF